MIFKIINTKYISVIFYSVFLFLLAGAQSFAATVVSPVGVCNIRGVSNFKGLVSSVINCFLRPSVVVIMALAVFIFLYKVFLYIQTEGVEKKQAGRDFMLWGIIGIFVMVSLWGLVNVLRRTFTFGTDITPRSINVNANL